MDTLAKYTSEILNASIEKKVEILAFISYLIPTSFYVHLYFAVKRTSHRRKKYMFSFVVMIHSHGRLIK